MRIPEPMAIEDAVSVEAFDAAATGHLLPFYRLNATMLSRLLPDHGVLVDLGSGSGRLLAHLADARRDVNAIGIDISESMIRTGRSMLRARSLDDRVELLLGDMTHVQDTLGLRRRVDLVSSVWSLHHLPTRRDVVRCLKVVAALREQYGCAVWLFDLVRLRHDQTMAAVMDVAQDVPPNPACRRHHQRAVGMDS